MVLAVRRLLIRARPDRARDLGQRECRLERWLTLLVCAGALGLALADGRPPPVTALLICLAAAVATASVSLHVGGGSATAAVLGTVPALWVLPLAWVPVTVAASLCLAALPGALAGRHPVWRVATAVGDAAYVFGPVVFLMATAGEPTPLLMIPAVLAQFALDGAVSTLREWLGRGFRPRLQLEVMAVVYGVDAALLPLAIVVGVQAEAQPAIVLSLLPLSLLLGAMARERNAHLSEAADRVAALELERDRVDVAIHRTGMALDAAGDDLNALELAVGSSVDALGAAAGRARLAGASAATTFEALPSQPGAADATALLAAERSALAGDEPVLTAVGGWHALAVPVRGIGAVSVCRSEPFTPRERRLFAFLAAQAGLALERTALAERVAFADRPDPQLGLPGRKQLQAQLSIAIERAERTETPLSLLLLDVDGLGTVNAVHGEAAGDAVLRSVAALVAGRCHANDVAAHYEEDRLVLLLPGTGLRAARLVAEDLRTCVLRRPVRSRHADIHVTVSIGVAEHTAAACTAEAILEAARRALVAAKAAGRNRTVDARA